MEEMIVRYKPVKIIPWEKSIRVSIPTEWSDITQEQALYLPRLITMQINEWKILEVFCGLPRKTAEKLSIESAGLLMKKALDLLYLDRVYDKFFVKSYGGYTAPDHGMINRRLVDLLSAMCAHAVIQEEEKLKHTEGSMAESARIHSVVMTEYSIAPFSNKKQYSFVDLLVANLYFDQDGIDSYTTRCDVVKAWDERIKTAIVLNYTLVEGWLKITYPLTFKFGTYFSNQNDAVFSWESLRLTGSEDMVFEALGKREAELMSLGFTCDFDPAEIEAQIITRIKLILLGSPSLN